MSTKHLNIDLSPLWENPEQKFIIRYNNINPKDQLILARRIKEAPTIYTIKISDNFTPQTIKSVLNEINPVIFAESTYNDYSNKSQTFGLYNVKSITSYHYCQLCKTIYYLLKTNKNINRNQADIIINTTLYPHTFRQKERMLNQLFNSTNQQTTHPLIEEPASLNSEPITIQNVRRTREITENENNDTNRNQNNPSDMDHIIDFPILPNSNYHNPNSNHCIQDPYCNDNDEEDEEDD